MAIGLRATRPTTDLMGVVGAALFGTGAEAMAKEREATVGAETILKAQQVEDVVAYLLTLKE